MTHSCCYTRRSWVLFSFVVGNDILLSLCEKELKLFKKINTSVCRKKTQILPGLWHSLYYCFCCCYYY